MLYQASETRLQLHLNSNTEAISKRYQILYQLSKVEHSYESERRFRIPEK